MAEAYFTVGVVTNTHGLQGEVKVFPRTDFEVKRFSPGSVLHVRLSGKSPFRQIIVRAAQKHKNLWIVAFDGVNSVLDAESLKGMELCVSKAELEPLPEGNYYIHDLIGLTVNTMDGVLIGELVDVLTPGANDVYVVRGSLQKKDILIPAIPSCVQSVDLESGVMSVIMLPGLLDEQSE